MRANFSRRIRIAWNAARFFLRTFIEDVAAVWLLGIAPFLAHLAAAPPSRGYAWVPNDLYLFMMVVAGNIAIEAFKDRASDGPIRPLAGVGGVLLAVFGAWAYGSLESGTAPVVPALRSLTYRIIVVVLSVDFAYRLLGMVRAAVLEARRKVDVV